MLSTEHNRELGSESTGRASLHAIKKGHGFKDMRSGNQSCNMPRVERESEWENHESGEHST